MKKFLLTLLASLSLLTAAGTLFALPTFAEGEDTTKTTWLQISPTAVSLTLEAGQDINPGDDACPNEIDAGCAVEVTNSGTQPFTFRVYASPYVVTGEDYSLSFSEDASTSYTQIYRWISFQDLDGGYVSAIQRQINPGETVTIPWKVDVPEDLPGGSQYAVIWAQTVRDGEATTTGVQTVSQAGMVVKARSTGDTRESADITEYNLQRFAFGGNLTASATVTNTGNTDFVAYYDYTAKTLFGKEIYTDSGDVSAFPDTTYHINIDWQDIPFLGIFQVNFRVSAAGTVTEESHIVVVMPVFIMVLLILLLTVIIVWIIIIIRKRQERKARKLV